MLRVLSVIVFLFTALSFGEVLYVKSVKAKLFEKPSLNSKVVAELKRGDKLNILKSGKDWLFVDANGVRGWIYSYLVSKNKPIKKISTIFKDEESEVIKARRRSSTNITAAAARGLTEDFRKRKKGKYVSDYESLRKMEDIRISEYDIEKFAEVLK